MTGTNELVNVAAHLPAMAARVPDHKAIVWTTRAGYSHWSFRELNEETDRYAHGLSRIGITRGMRTILMVRPSPQFFALTFALYKIGAVPVLIDPGMGREKMVECLASVEATAFIGIPLAHVLRVLHPGAFRGVRIVVTVGRRWCWGGYRLSDLRATDAQPFAMAPTSPDDPAAIIFTTGSTGPPKGVLYRHGMFDAQVQILRDHFGIQPGEIDLPTFPLFALFDPALGMTAVIPDMDPTRPGFVDPQKIIAPIRDLGVTHMFGSPALLNRVGRYGAEHGITLPTLRRVISAGAPVPPSTLETFGTMLVGDAQIHTPYGATEALPVASIASREILGETRKLTESGHGTCVGRPMPNVTLRIIRITDDPIATWSDDLVLPVGEVGEIAVKGSVVTREYLNHPQANALAKIRDGNEVWHRMGDLGRLDETGRLWFYGRKAHRVESNDCTLFTEPCEAIFNQHPKVFRSALVGLGPRKGQQPAMCIELEPSHAGADHAALISELAAMARQHDHTRGIRTFLVHPRFPVDIRHNAKIFREKLAIWAAKQLDASDNPH
ncbi:MAG: AMP-binding protein [Planctomycetes bacterium]|nr:AMP-binding protein [Planctomycetota bacterium]